MASPSLVTRLATLGAVVFIDGSTSTTNVSHFGSLWLVGRIFVQMAVAATS
jgi:hypothetical protein